MDKAKKKKDQTKSKRQSGDDSKPSAPRKSEKPKRKYDQTIFRDWCKACGICSAFCPRSVLGQDESGTPVVEKSDECIGCRFCELHCPDFAITIKQREGEAQGEMK